MEELPIQPSGLFWQDEFVTAEHEAQLLEIFAKLCWPEAGPGRRLSLHYGRPFSYTTFGVDDANFQEYPDWLVALLPPGLDRPDSATLQYYPPGSGIPPHVDTHSAFGRLFALSLGAPVLMQFARDRGDGTKDKVDVDLSPRSMLEMAGDARLHWTHGIRKRKTDTLPDGTVRPRRARWSITFRWLRDPPVCECGDAGLCDTAQARLGVERLYRWKAGQQ